MNGAPEYGIARRQYSWCLLSSLPSLSLSPSFPVQSLYLYFSVTLSSFHIHYILVILPNILFLSVSLPLYSHTRLFALRSILSLVPFKIATTWVTFASAYHRHRTVISRFTSRNQFLVSRGMSLLSFANHVLSSRPLLSLHTDQ